MSAPTLELGQAGTPPWWRRSTDFFAHLISAMNSAGTLWVFAIMFMVCADIIATNAFRYPLRGVTELVAGYFILPAQADEEHGTGREN